MRILILTHGRSGGLSFMAWLGHEMGYPTLHEPFSNPEEIKRVFTEKNIIVKDFPDIIINAGYNLEDVISSFDKVIIHKRNNILDTAISSSYTNDSSKLHKVYQVTKEWIGDNKDKIDSNIQDFQVVYDILDNIESNALKTTYEGLYQTRKDIDRIAEYLGIKEFRWLDILDYKRKLRNGDVGMSNLVGIPTPTPTPIPKKLI